MRALLLALATFCAVSVATAGDDIVMKTPNGYVRLSEHPCTHEKVLVLLTEQWKPRFKQGFLLFQGRDLQLCWIDHPEDPGKAVVIDEEGDGGVVELKDFKPASGV